jgi:nitrogenase molybdenum-iron protein alpha/beta subunit
MGPPSHATRLIPLEVDGDIHGDFSDGARVAYLASMELVDEDVEAEEGLVNVIGEKSLLANRELNFSKVSGMLQRVGLRVNCRFMGNTTVESIKGFKRAGLNLMAHADATNESVKAALSKRFKGTYFDKPYPVGQCETASWLRGLAALTGKRGEAEELIEQSTVAFAPSIKDLEQVSGRSVVILADGMGVDWLLDVLQSFQMEIPKVIVTPFQGRGPEPYQSSRARFVTVTDESALEQEIEESDPDLLLSTWPSRCPVTRRYDIVPAFPEVGFEADRRIARRLARVLRLPAREGWREGARP